MKCPNCKTKIIKFPLKDSEGKLIVKNLFKMDWMSIMWFIVIMFLVISYKADIKTCEEITTNPLKYCEESNACKIIEERKSDNPFGVIDIDNIPDFDDLNNTKW